jgi:hypothetical protein
VYFSLNIKIIKSKKLRGAKHIANMGEMRNAYKIYGRIILKIFLKKKNGYVNFVKLTENRSQWRALVNTIMNLRGISYEAERLLASYEGLWSMELVKYL